MIVVGELQHHPIVVLRLAEPVQPESWRAEGAGLRAVGVPRVRKVQVEIRPAVREPHRLAELGLDDRVRNLFARLRIEQDEGLPVTSALLPAVADEGSVGADRDATDRVGAPSGEPVRIDQHPSAVEELGETVGHEPDVLVLPPVVSGHQPAAATEERHPGPRPAQDRGHGLGEPVSLRQRRQIVLRLSRSGQRPRRSSRSSPDPPTSGRGRRSSGRAASPRGHRVESAGRSARTQASHRSTLPEPAPGAGSPLVSQRSYPCLSWRTSSSSHRRRGPGRGRWQGPEPRHPAPGRVPGADRFLRDDGGLSGGGRRRPGGRLCRAGRRPATTSPDSTDWRSPCSRPRRSRTRAGRGRGRDRGGVRPARRGRAGRGPVVGHRRRPGGGELRRPAGHVPQRGRRGRRARRGTALLGLVVDGPGGELPGRATASNRPASRWRSSSSEMVTAVAAGVMFTADPVAGTRRPGGDRCEPGAG